MFRILWGTKPAGKEETQDLIKKKEKKIDLSKKLRKKMKKKKMKKLGPLKIGQWNLKLHVPVTQTQKIIIRKHNQTNVWPYKS